jgi:3-isopropylmalate/(R)-2-methylmalate dehydratase large subunit
LGRTFAEKIFARKAGLAQVAAGDIVNVAPDVVMTLDADAEIMHRFRELGLKKIRNPERIVCFLDHYAPASTLRTANLHKSMREFAREQGFQRFYDVGEGLAHEVVIAKGHVLPGELAVGTDSHTPSYGAVGAFGCGVGASDMLSIWATGELWFKVPESVKVLFRGRIPLGVFAKDLILEVIGHFKARGGTYQCVEFHGETLREISLEERIVLANVSVEMGVKASYVLADEMTRAFADPFHRTYEAIHPDPDAAYKNTFELDVQTLTPRVACPHSVDNVKPLSAVEGTRIDQAFIGTCASGRLEEFRVAAKILQGGKIASGVRLLIAPASRAILLRAIELGYVSELLTAGATLLPPGCGPCAGIHEGLLADGERCISTANRNFIGRMGSQKAEIFLGSAATVAASARKGVISDPREFLINEIPGKDQGKKNR